MALAMNTPIAVNDINRITELKLRKVWLLTGHSTPPDELVIKLESPFVTEKHYNSVNQFVKVVDITAEAKILTVNEIRILDNYINRYFSIAKLDRKWRIEYDFEEATAINNLKDALRNKGANQPVVKMHAFNLTTLGTALERRLAPPAQRNKTDLRAFTNTLNGPDGLERLGRIIAVDLFVGNNDRFNPEQGQKLPIDGKQVQLRHLLNLENVFLVNTADGHDVGALDFCDPTTLFKDIDIPLSKTETVKDKWPGRILADKVRRNNFAKDVVYDLEIVLNSHRWKFSSLIEMPQKWFLMACYMARSLLRRNWNRHIIPR